MKKFLKNQFTFLFYGFVFWLPIGVLIVILVFLFSNFENIGSKILQVFIPARYMHYGFGIVFGILIVYVSGIVLKLTRVRGMLARIPFVGQFLGAGEMMTIDRLLHLVPCLFLLSPTCPAYGWILSEQKVKLNEEPSDFLLINVYYPAVPALVTGEVLPIRKDMVIRLGNSSREIIDLLLYSLRVPKEIKYLPWGNESEIDFENRAKYFGLDSKIDNN
jgi:uncharacterized membrane protein